MDDIVLSPETMLRAASNVFGNEIDPTIDNVFLGELWSDIFDGSYALSDSNLFVCPASGKSLDELNTNPSESCCQEDRQESLINEARGNDPLYTQSPIGTIIHTNSTERYSRGLEGQVIENSELNRRWWIGAKTNPCCGPFIMERLLRALWYTQEIFKNKSALIQIWVPVNREGRRVLVTRDQPFTLDPICRKLGRYRDISLKYCFSVDEDPKGSCGLPGRVFLGKVPEWTPDVRFYRTDEYPQLSFAKQYDVRGTFVLPFFEQGSRVGLGVIEVVMTTQQISYRSEIEIVCKALEAVDLRSSEVFSSAQRAETWSMYHEALLPEILEVLESACETYRLPLAQAWVPCVQRSKDGCWRSDENRNQCFSRMDFAFYVTDPLINCFAEACSEHHMLKGQGVVGKAFMTNQPCFSTDITSFCKREYPLSHHARVSELRAAIAIRLRSIHTSTADFVLEFFLPSVCTDSEEQKKILTSLGMTLCQCCRSLRAVTDNELELEDSDFLEFQVGHPLDVVDQTSATKDSSFVKENPREALDGELLPETSYQNEKCSEPTPNMEPATGCDVIGQASFASAIASETTEEKHTIREKTPCTSLNNAAKRNEAKITGTVRKKRDSAWKYCSSIEGNSNGVICSFCGLVIQGGGITRFKSHLSNSDPSKNVKKCENVPLEVKFEMEKRMKRE